MKKIVLSLSFLVVSTYSSLSSATHYYDRKPNISYLSKICIVYANTSIQQYWQDGAQMAAQKFNQFFSANPSVNFSAGYPVGCSHFIELRRKTPGYYVYRLYADRVSYWSRRPGDFIDINTERESEFYSKELRAGILMHEIGHALGINHTGSGDGSQIPNTGNDSQWLNSIFVSHNDNSASKHPVLTNFDKRALEFIVTP